MGQLSLYSAKKYSSFKWRYVLGLNSSYPKKIDKFNSNCGFCERHKRGNIAPNCSNCELMPKIGICFDKDSLFKQWYLLFLNDLESKIIATQILEAIESIPAKPNLWERIKNVLCLW